MQPVVPVLDIAGPRPLAKIGITDDLERRLGEHSSSYFVLDAHREYVDWYSKKHPYVLDGNIEHEFVLQHARQYKSRGIAENVERFVLGSIKQYGIVPSGGNEWFRPRDLGVLWLAVGAVEVDTDEKMWRTALWADGRMKISVHTAIGNWNNSPNSLY